MKNAWGITLIRLAILGIAFLSHRQACRKQLEPARLESLQASNPLGEAQARLEQAQKTANGLQGTLGQLVHRLAAGHAILRAGAVRVGVSSFLHYADLRIRL
jgi:hypothetical protein